MSRIGRGLFLFVLVSGFGGGTLAIDRIPEQPGWKGFVLFGGGGIEVESNLIAGTDLGDVSNRRIDSIFESPDSKSSTNGILNFELAYTFGSSRTQLFLGNLLEDVIRFDFATQLGVRKQFSDTSILAGGLVFSSIPTEVWRDPYVDGSDRRETDRTSAGARLTYDRIAGTGLRLQYTLRNIDVDTELSGRTFLGLSDAQAALLDRDGDRQSLEMLYSFVVGERNFLLPSARYTRDDRDGGAMSSEMLQVQLTTLFTFTRYTLVANLGLGSAEYDEVNPIYGVTRDDDSYGANVTLFRRFGKKGWSGFAAVQGAKEDSNIAFYDSSLASISVGAIYRFAAQRAADSR